MDIKSCCVLIFLYNVDLSVAGWWVEGTIKKKEKKKKKKRKRTGKHFVMLWGVTRCNFWCQVVWVLPQFSFLYFYPTPTPTPHSVCLFVCLFFNCSLLFLRDTTDLSYASWKYVSDGKHRPALHSIWFRKRKIDYFKYTNLWCKIIK